MAVKPPRRKVLIIEDEPSIRSVLYVLLAGLGYDGNAVPDAYQGLSMIRRGEFDAVLLDLRSSQLPLIKWSVPSRNSGPTWWGVSW